MVCGSNDKKYSGDCKRHQQCDWRFGTTINWASPVNYRQGIDGDFEQLITDLEAGTVGTLMIYGANPVYTYYNAERFKAALKKAKVTVSFNEKWMRPPSFVNTSFLHIITSKAGVMLNLAPAAPALSSLLSILFSKQGETSLLKWSGDT